MNFEQQDFHRLKEMKPKQMLEELLAHIHGDGGHHTANVGLAKSLHNAENKLNSVKDNKLKLYWSTRYVKDGVEKPDDLNRWLIEGSLKIYYPEDPYYGEYYAKVAFITMSGTANASFLDHSSLPKFNVRVSNVLAKSDLFNTGYGATSQFFDSVDECKQFAERAMNFHYDMLDRAEKL